VEYIPVLFFDFPFCDARAQSLQFLLIYMEFCGLAAFRFCITRSHPSYGNKSDWICPAQNECSDRFFSRRPIQPSNPRWADAWQQSFLPHLRKKITKVPLHARLPKGHVYPKRNLSKPAPGHKIYPYLLKGLAITRPNQVWSTDITYIRLAGGFVYLVAIIDWYSRYVLAWNVSVTLDSAFCLEALDEALRLYGKPDIFNSDQGCQFTSIEFTNRLKAEGIRISMDGRGRALDNIFVERLWRSVKYEDVYLHDYATVPEAVLGLKKYFLFYNTERQHQSLDNQTPQEVNEAELTGGVRALCAA